jgi:hypothetical protein
MLALKNHPVAEIPVQEWRGIYVIHAVPEHQPKSDSG